MNKFEVQGKMSTFGGPNDTGMSPTEGLALFSSADQMKQHGLGDYLLSPEQAGASGLGRRLNPDKYYVACRWHTGDYPWLRDNGIWVQADGKRIAARAVDWGPNTSTHRVADLSPGLANALGLETDNICRVVADPNDSPGAKEMLVGSGATGLADGPQAAGVGGGGGGNILRTPNGRAEIEAMFGRPNNTDGTLNEAWESQNIRRVTPPTGWQLFYQDDDHGPVPVSGIRIHRKLEDSFRAVLQDIWARAQGELGGGANDAAVRQWLHDRRLDQHGGGFNYRVIHGSSRLSLHSYGIAIDWDPDHNIQGHSTHTLPDWWYDIWARHGWSDGRHFSNPDPMHVQFATGA